MLVDDEPCRTHGGWKASVDFMYLCQCFFIAAHMVLMRCGCFVLGCSYAMILVQHNTGSHIESSREDVFCPWVNMLNEYLSIWGNYKSASQPK